MSKIGLKLANGEFYPVLEEATAARKRLVVTTVQDGQRSVQIDIYRGSGSTVAGAEYVGSLVIDNIPFSPKGEPDIRLDLEVDAEGKLKAYAEELSSGEHQSIELSLEALNEEGSYEIPDFALEEATDSLPEDDILGPDNGPVPAYSGAEIAGSVSEDILVEEPRSRKPLVIALFAILALALVLGGAWLVYHYAIAPKSAQVQVETPPPPPVVAEAPAPAPVVVEAPAPIPAPVVEAAPPPPPEPAKPKFKKPGVNYKLRWGDTLWDLSYTYYQNPWLYMKIAKANKIRNPDYIISGHTIWIPPR